MKWTVENIIGKTIKHVVVVERDREPKQQMYLVFTDDTWIEFYGDWFNCTRTLDIGHLTSLLTYLQRSDPKDIDVYPTTSETKLRP